MSLAEVRCSYQPCTTLFVPTKPWQKFCGTKCRMGDANRRRHEGLKLLAAAIAAPLELVSGMSSTGAST